MFGGSVSTEYEDIVNKTTDENLTSENWELILNLCDKVQDEGQTGAHAAIAAILKRLAHRNPNVQLYALSLTESLSKNLGIEIHRELASKAFTQGIEKLITDRNTHEKVRRRALGLVAMWTTEFEKDETLGIMEDCYNNLKAKNYKFEPVEEPPPPTIDDEIRRKEEEELQRVLEMSMQDKGGRGQWAQYSLASDSSSSGAGASSSAAASRPSGATSAPHPFAAPKYSGGGYVPARTPSPDRVAAQQRQQAAYYQQQQAQHAQQQHRYTSSSASSVAESTAPTITPVAAAPTPSAVPAQQIATPAATPSSQPPASMNIVTRVRALHTFEPTEPGELAFEKGDIIKVVDRGYKDWWRGQLKGRTGIFPVNYVEAMPEPTAAELAREAEQEAAVFAQAVNVEKLLNMLRALDPAKDNLADNEEIQELYRSSMALRPKIVKLIDKYSQKRADLVSMNETFVRARTIFDRMMEESLARHTGVYEQAPTFRVPQYGPPPQARPDSRGPAPRRPEFAQPAQSAYGWNATPGAPAGYPGYGAPANTYPATSPGPQQAPPQQYVDPAAAAAAAYGAPPVGTPQGAPQQPVTGGYGVVPQGGYAGHQPQVPYSQQGPTPYPAQQQQQQQQQPVQTPMQQQPVQVQPAQQPIQQQPVQQPIQQQPMQPQAVQQAPIQQQPVQQQQHQQPVQQQPVQQPAQQPMHQPPAQQPIPQAVQPQPVQQQPIQQEPVPQQTAQPAQQPAQQYPVQAQPEVQPAAASPAATISPQPQPQTQAQQPQAAEPQQQSQSPAQAQPAQPITGPPPYVYNPSYTYADPNVQAWAQYYAQGGKDLAGSVYFVSIPGVTDGPPTSPHPAQGQPQAQAQAASQPQQAQSELAYAADPARAASPQQQQQRPLSYQLHDQPVSQAQHAGSPSSPTGMHNSGAAAAPAQDGSNASPTAAASNVPSWVIPKKTAAGAGAGGTPAAGGADSYFPQLANQMGGVTLTDPGSGSAVSG